MFSLQVPIQHAMGSHGSFPGELLGSPEGCTSSQRARSDMTLEPVGLEPVRLNAMQLIASTAKGVEDPPLAIGVVNQFFTCRQSRDVLHASHGLTRHAGRQGSVSENKGR